MDFVTTDRKHALRLWSARSAEIVAISFLSDLGKQTTDVSIRQLDTNSDDWKTHDVDADGDPIDVKNARRSFSSQDSYVKHTIPMFKYARRLTSDVTVLGILSDYVSWAQIDTGWLGSAMILGQVRNEDLVALASWMDRNFGDILDFGVISGNRSATYPGWVFEYPEQWYVRRPEAMNQIRGLLKECPEPLKARKVIPSYVYAFLDESEQTSVKDGTKLDADLFREFGSLRREIGLSRRSLFGWILGVMLRALIDRGGISVAQTTASLRRLLFVPDSTETPRNPAGLFDPAAYISNLITMFEAIGRNIRPELLQSIRFFDLSAPTILRGRLADGRWQTVFAHCGGCGKNPIHLGNSETCPECGFLICGECAHCSISCSAQRPNASFR